MNYIFVCAFALEAILKLIALGPKQYFRDPWNSFDCFVSVISVICKCSCFPFSGVYIRLRARMCLRVCARACLLACACVYVRALVRVFLYALRHRFFKSVDFIFFLD